MKKTILPFLAITLAANVGLAGNWFGSGPWANDAYYPGQLDGKYQASVTGVNIAGAVGFAFQDGAPTSSSVTAAGASNNITVDPSLNYFVIFVQGVTYSGTTTATINLDQNTVTGALYSGASSFSTITTDDTVFITNSTGVTPVVIENVVLDNLALLNRGVNGGFTANIKSKNSLFNFSGTGELSAPAFPQSVLGFDTNGTVVPPDRFISDAVTAVVDTATVPFDIQGIKVSFSGASSTSTTTTSN
jgi:hypothetical protein